MTSRQIAHCSKSLMPGILAAALQPVPPSGRGGNYRNDATIETS